MQSLIIQPQRRLPALVVGSARLQIDSVTIRKPVVLTFFHLVADYLQNYALPQKDVDVARYIYVFNDLLRVIGPATRAVDLNRDTFRAYAVARRREKVTDATIHREQSFLRAVMYRALAEGRIDKLPSFKNLLCVGAPPRERILSQDEFQCLMDAPKPARIQKFLIIDFYCGVRSRAIEELTWDRVSFEARTIDFRVPGVVYKKKRRPLQPIIDSLMPFLEAWHRERTDDFVIGLGARGRCSTTYHQCKAAMRSVGIDERGVARHVGRHTVVNWLLQAKQPLLDVANYIGDRATTVERNYAHSSVVHTYSSVNVLHQNREPPRLPAPEARA